MREVHILSSNNKMGAEEGHLKQEEILNILSVSSETGREVQSAGETQIKARRDKEKPLV